MQTFLYQLAVSAYHLAIRLAALLGGQQAQLWVIGRQNPAASQLPPHLRARQRTAPLLWIHCASLGEWEQGRPVLEALRERLPDHKVLLTFFSPSGYERCKDTPLADHVAYLPADGPVRARSWVADLAPELAIFVKYEFWFFHLRALHQAGVPIFLVAASFRPGQPFFQWWGGWWRTMLGFFTRIMVQTSTDAELLTGPGRQPAEKVLVAGDPRMDRTRQLAETPFTDTLLAAFAQEGTHTIIAGSVWPPDVALWQAIWARLPENCRLVLAPHQLHEAEITGWAEALNAARYTQASPENVVDYRVLLLDTIGILSRAYRFGEVAYVGGAFKTGLHNTLEPLAYGLPVIFGPRHQKFPEAGAAIRQGGGFSVDSPEVLLAVVQQLLHPEQRAKAAFAQRELGEALAGAGRRTAEEILRYLPAETGQ